MKAQFEMILSSETLDYFQIIAVILCSIINFTKLFSYLFEVKHLKNQVVLIKISICALYSMSEETTEILK